MNSTPHNHLQTIDEREEKLLASYATFSSQTKGRKYAETATLKRQGTPRELADAVLFLVSEASTYITGSTLHVNGGALLV